MTGPAGARVSDHLFENLDSLSATLAALIAAKLRAALEARPAASLVVAGGRTPAGVLARLSNETLAWDRVFVTLTDERWVSSDNPASNAAMLRKTLLVGAAAPARFIPLYTGVPTPDEALQSVSAGLATAPRPFDIMVLGMGNDGHTASLFPGADNLGAALAPNGHSCMAIRAPGAPQPRITLTLPTLLDARSLLVLFTGPSKRQTYAVARKSGPIEDMPIRGVLRNALVPVDVFYTA